MKAWQKTFLIVYIAVSVIALLLTTAKAASHNRPKLPVENHKQSSRVNTSLKVCQSCDQDGKTESGYRDYVRAILSLG